MKTKPHYKLGVDGYLYLDGVFAGYLEWGGWYDRSGCLFRR